MNMKMKRIVTGVLAGVMLFGTAQSLTPMKQAVAAEKATKCTQNLSTEKSIVFENKPMEYTCQKFYIDDKKEYLYATYKPVGGTDDHLLCRYVLDKAKTEWVATCESFMILEDSGHGMILDGETIKNKTYLYVGCEAKGGEATGVARIDYNALSKYEYDESIGRWKYNKAKSSKDKNETVPTLESIEFYKSENIAGVKKNSISKYKTIKSQSNFVKGDFCVASTGAHMIYEKYNKKKGKEIDKKNPKLKIKKIGENFNLTDQNLKDFVGTVWQATDAWTKYDTFFTTQSEVKKFNANNTGLKIVRRSGAKYQHKDTYSLNLPKKLFDKIKDKSSAYDNKKKLWRVEIEGVQVIPSDSDSNKVTTYVYVCSKEKGKFNFENIFYFDVKK